MHVMTMSLLISMLANKTPFFLSLKFLPMIVSIDAADDTPSYYLRSTYAPGDLPLRTLESSGHEKIE